LIHIILGNIPFPLPSNENAPCGSAKDPAAIHRHFSWKERKKVAVTWQNNNNNFFVFLVSKRGMGKDEDRERNAFANDNPPCGQ
jgi:hypothetical protein